MAPRGSGCWKRDRSQLDSAVHPSEERSKDAPRSQAPACAIFHHMTVDAVSDLDLSYTPPLGSPWEAIQMGAQAWVRATQRH